MAPTAIVLFGCVLFGASALAETALQQSTMVAAVAGAVIAELGGGKIGVAWNDPSGPMPTASRNVRQATAALALGVLSALLALGVAFAVGSVHREAHGRPLLVPMALGLLESVFFAVQAEILQRGVLRVFCKKTEPRLLLPLAVLIAVAATAGRVGLQLPALAAAASLALAMALAWNRTGGALVPIFMHAGHRFVLDTLASGSGFGLVGSGSFAGSPLTRGFAAALGLLVLAAGLAFVRRSAPPRDA